MRGNISLLKILSEDKFRNFWLTQVFVLIAIQFYFISLSWMTLDLTDSTVLLGTLLTITAVPRLIIMPIGGALADIISPSKLLMINILLLFFSSLFFTITMYLGYLEIWMLVVFSIIFGISTALFLPTSFSIIPKLVNESRLQSANSLAQLGLQLSTSIGPALAGVIISLFGLPSIYLTITILFIISLLFSLAIGHIETDNQDRHNLSFKGVFIDIVDGIKIVRGIPLLIALIFISALLNISVIGPQQIGLPYIAQTSLEGGAHNLGFIMSALGAGTLVGALLIGLLNNIKSPIIIAFSVAVVLGGIWSLVGVFQNKLAVISTILFFSGICIGVLNVLILTLIQRKSPKNAIGRVMSLQLLGSTGIQPVSFLIVGWLLDIISVTTLFILSGLIISITSLISLMSKNIRQPDLYTKSRAL